MKKRHTCHHQTSLALVCTLLVLAVAPAWSMGPDEGITRHRRPGERPQTPGDRGAKFVSLPADAGSKALPGASVADKADGFLADYGEIFGIKDPAAEFERLGVARSPAMSHVSYQQFHYGVPVFAGALRASFDRNDKLVAVNGVFLPDLSLSVKPSWKAPAAEEIAVRHVAGQENASDLSAAASKLFVFRAGLLQGVPGPNHLAWEVEVINAIRSIREFVYVDAHTGKVIDQITGIHKALDREVSQQTLSNVLWSKGDPDPRRLVGRLGPAGRRLAGRDRRRPRVLQLLRQHDQRRLPVLRRRHGPDAHRQQRSRHQLPERQLERHLDQLLHRRHSRRRGDPRVGSRLHRVHQQPDLPVAVGGLERELLRHLGRDRRHPERPRHRLSPGRALGGRLLDL